MAEQQIVTQSIPVSLARQRFGELINQVYRRRLRVIVEKSGIPVAALVSLADLERWTEQEPTGERKEAVPMEEKRTLFQPPTPEEIARRQALVARILTKAEGRVIAPLKTTDLVHKVRQEERKAHERWTR